MGASASCICVPEYSKDEVKKMFPVVNDVNTFRSYIEYAINNNHLQKIHRLLKKDGFIEREDELPFCAKDILTTDDHPFNVFAKYGSFVLKNLVDQSILGKYAEHWMVCHNKPECDNDWDNVNNNNVSMCGPDENGPGHVFITTQDLNWKLFNITTIVLSKNVKFLLRLKEVASYYARQRGWGKAGFYFHCFPHNTVNSLHLHVCNEDENYIGHAHTFAQYKNLSLDAAITVALD